MFMKYLLIKKHSNNIRAELKTQRGQRLQLMLKDIIKPVNFKVTGKNAMLSGERQMLGYP